MDTNSSSESGQQQQQQPQQQQIQQQPLAPQQQQQQQQPIQQLAPQQQQQQIQQPLVQQQQQQLSSQPQVLQPQPQQPLQPQQQVQAPTIQQQQPQQPSRPLSIPHQQQPSIIQVAPSQSVPCSIPAGAPGGTVVTQLAAQPGGTVRAVQPGQARPHTEYVVLLTSNPRQPGMQGIRYPIQAMNLNQPGILQANPALLRSINASQLIRAQTSSQSGVMQTQTSQAQTTTMANIQGRHLHIPFSAAGPRGQIALTTNGAISVPSIPMQRHPMMTSRATILQQPMIRGVTTQQTAGMVMGHNIIPATSQALGLAGLQTAIVGAPQQPGDPHGQQQQANLPNNSSNTATAPSQMTPDIALNKGIIFLSSLLGKFKDGSPEKMNVRNLVQTLIDGKSTPEQFAASLQEEVNSGQQTQQLVPFLELLLPNLRQSMNLGIIRLPDIRPPNQQGSPLVSMGSGVGIGGVSENSQLTNSTTPLNSSNLVSPNKVQSPVGAAKKKKPILPPGQKSAYAIKKEAREAKKKEKEAELMLANIKTENTTDDSREPDKTTTDKLAKPKVDKTKRQDKQKKQDKQLESLSSALRDDDDVNDVAAMGGVNLAEESQRIMASGAELVGTQIRSCKDEPFLDMTSLTARIARIAKEHNLAEPTRDVVTLVSHATQERLKNMVERLGVLAEHRSENLKLDPKYEISNDIKGQMKFLAELDRIEKRRYEEQERELLLRVAKSRSKVEDPEQQKLRQKAKDMQRAEQEEVRQREANETALLAIGPRKKLKTNPISSAISSSFSQSSTLRDIKTSLDMRGDTIRRIKRVNMRDLQVLFELDRTHLNRLIKITSQ